MSSQHAFTGRGKPNNHTAKPNNANTVRHRHYPRD